MRKKQTKLYKASFRVPYQAGKLTAVEVNENGKGDSVILETTGEPVALRLTADKTKMKAHGQDLSYVLIELVDKKEISSLTNDRKIQISHKGTGKIIGSGMLLQQIWQVSAHFNRCFSKEEQW